MDSNVLVYSLLKNHPAHEDCARYLSSHDFENTLFSTSNSINEVYQALVYYYHLDSREVMRNITALLDSAIVFNHPGTAKDEICKIALESGLQLNDVELYHLALETQSPVFVTDDVKLASFVKKHGLLCETPIQPATRDAMTRWEDAHVPQKGLPRILASVYHYLSSKQGAGIARDFKADTKGLTKLPIR
ncbi:MAG: type II toxin-antitoxin system VapC family toxin [Candidatus Lokiarchaeota archaeon]|nr:type II toxin-antitoxin system VapC family toxin [Candidatus Lokiarchaeota archaeon]